MEASSPKEHQGSTSSSALSFAAASDSSIPPSVESLGEKPAGVSSHISSENSSEAGPTPESEGGCAPQQPDAASTLATPPDVVPSNPSFTSADPPTPSSVTAAHYSSAKGSRKHHSHHLRHDGSRHYGYSMPTALSQHYESRGSRGHQRGSRHHHINHRPLRFSGDTSTLTSTEDLEGLEARLASAARPIAPQRGHGGPLSSTTSSLSIITTNSLGSSTSSCTTGFSGSRESALQPYLPPPPLPVPAPPLSSLPSVAAPGCGFVLRIDPQRMREYPRGKVALAPGFSMRDWTMKVVEQAQLNKRYSSTTISPEPPALDPQVATAQYGSNTAHVLVRAGEEAAAADRGYAHVRRVYDRRQRFTAAEVAQHNTREDLWIVLHDVVYDCTEYQQYHPGGGAILLPCAGKDATALFSAFHHWISLEAMLGPYAVGVVEKSEVTL